MINKLESASMHYQPRDRNTFAIESTTRCLKEPDNDQMENQTHQHLECSHCDETLFEILAT